MLRDGACCDSANCTADCNSALSFCFRTGETSHDELGCPTVSTLLGTVGGDSVTFTNAVGNKANPFVLRLNILPAVCCAQLPACS